MRIHVRSRHLLFLAIAVAACSDMTLAPSHGAPPQSGGNGPAATPAVVYLDVAPNSGSTVPLGVSFTFSAVAVRSDNVRIPATSPQWTSLNDAILAVNPATGDARALGVGSTSVVVRANGVSATVVVTVLPPSSPGISSALTVSAFSVVEFDYPSQPGYWFYAPQVSVTAAPGISVTVLDLRFSVPGFDPIPSFDCGGAVPAGASRDLNGEVYGDWEFTFDHGGSRPAGDDVSLVLTFIDDTGATGTITAQGKIVHGALPTTYGGDPGACFHGIS